MPDPRDRDVSPEDRRKVTKAAFLRPMNMFVLIIGSVFFAATGLWWIAPLTILTYASVVTLAARDPLFERRILEGRPSSRALTNPTPSKDISPERRARWLPRGETRRRVEESLEVYRKAVRAIEESDELTREVLEDATPRLHAAADHLVDLAQEREKAAQVLNELPEDVENESTRDLEGKIQAADAEISGVIEKFVELRTRVVRISLDSGPAAQAMAGELNSSLDELNFRLEALGETMSDTDQGR